MAAIEERYRANQLAGLTQGVQHLLREGYQRLASERRKLPDFADVEFRCTSQNGEDGIIHYIFSLIGARTRKAVELCAGHGIECNSANLIINHGWRALLVDGDPANVSLGSEFYARCQDTFSQPPTFVSAWITKDNVNDLVTAHGFAGEIDLLSVDVDGMDYWIWKELRAAAPRLVVAEFNPVWGPELAVSVPYDPAFKLDLSKRPYYCSASLSAFTKLGREKGYRLVGVERLGFNAFFLKDGVGEDLFPAITAAECFQRSAPLRSWKPEHIPTPAERPDFGGAVEV
jgi:hypothetical protein